MTTSVQILLIIVIAILTILLSITGIQIFLILKELKKSIEKTNTILDDAKTISESVARPISLISESITSLSGLTGLFGWLLSRKYKKEGKKEDKGG